MLIGGFGGHLTFYRNDGNTTTPNWTFITNTYDSIDVGISSAPGFVDVEGDGDYDLFIGDGSGRISYYRNDGNSFSPIWNLISTYYDSIDVNFTAVPAFEDLDDDGDFDMFIGGSGGSYNDPTFNYYENSGDLNNPSWTLLTDFFDFPNFSFSLYCRPSFVDIDNDDDFDLFIGDYSGSIWFFRNDGDVTIPDWTFITNAYDSIDVGQASAPSFVDIDGDGDFDMFIGERYGHIWFYRNDGTTISPLWNRVATRYNSIDVNYRATPTFTDIDNDGDFDMFIGEWEYGRIFFYRNIGNNTIPSWELVTQNYNTIDGDKDSAPTFADIDSDGDFDMFVGRRWGRIAFSVTMEQRKHPYGY